MITAEQISKERNVTERSVQKKAKETGIKKRNGRYLFTDEDLERMYGYLSLGKKHFVKEAKNKGPKNVNSDDKKTSLKHDEKVIRKSLARSFYFMNKIQLAEYFDSLQEHYKEYPLLNDFLSASHETRSYDEYFRLVYTNYLSTSLWKIRRQIIFNYYENNCKDCTDIANEIHHLTYKNVFKEEFNDLIPLCTSCHEKRHSLTDNRKVIRRKVAGLSLKGIHEKKTSI